ncbi:PREDICTED: microtubule-actin cross-linking factor 1 isoform X5 [Nicrophorus vespilloides]|uniref:Microtubule-actin cross-linking factor 1 isoform X5 n=1 Tax=Nicrophorus vespilloides TaxID=110193 RepID=A0ABM1NBD2_NICVS|nr:PREDICTED: microtubule-actin cross-linking factor 1 isoform X5 [Nicrophorus vespilloides]
MSFSKAIDDGKVDLLTGNYRLESGEIITTQQAFQRGYLTNSIVKLETSAVCLFDAINRGLVDERTGWIVDRNSGNKYQVDAAIKTKVLDGQVREIVDPKTDNKITLLEALEKGIINPKLGKYVYHHEKLPFLEAKRRQLILKPLTLKDALDLNLLDNDCKIWSPLHQTKLSILEAVSRGVLDSNSIQSITNVARDELLTLSDAIASGIILPHGIYVNNDTDEKIDIPDAIKRGFITSVTQKSIFDTDGFRPPDKFDYISFNSASAKGYISKKDNGSLVTNIKSGKLISFADGVATGEVKPDVHEMLTRKIGIFENGRELSVLEAVFRGYIDPKTGNFIDISKNKIVPLNEAIAQNLITSEGAALLNSLLTIYVTSRTTSKQIQKYVTHPKPYEPHVISYTEAIHHGLIDNDNQTFRDLKSDKVIPIVQALSEGKLAPDGYSSGVQDPKSTGAYPKGTSPSKTTISVIQIKQDPEGKLKDPKNSVSKPKEKQVFELPPDGWLLSDSIRLNMFDPITGLFTIPGTDRLVSFEECLAMQIINANSATVVDPVSRDHISLTRSLDKKILDSVGRYNLNNKRITMKEAIDKSLIILDDNVPMEQSSQRLLQVTKEPGQPDRVEVSDVIDKNPPVYTEIKDSKTDLSPIQLENGAIYDPSNATVILPDKTKTLFDAIADKTISPNSVKIKDPVSGNDLTINEAIQKNIVDKDSGTYIDRSGRRMTFSEASKFGLIAIAGTPILAAKSIKQIFDSKKGSQSLINSEKSPEQSEMFVETKIVLTDPKTGKRYSPEEAADVGLITKEDLEVLKKETPKTPDQSILGTDPTTGTKTALHVGIMTSQQIVTEKSTTHYSYSQTDFKTVEKMDVSPIVDSKMETDTLRHPLVSKEELETAKNLLKPVTVTKTADDGPHKLKPTIIETKFMVVNPKTGQKIPAQDALRLGLITPEQFQNMRPENATNTNIYIKNSKTGQNISAEEAVRLGLISASELENLKLKHQPDTNAFINTQSIDPKTDLEKIDSTSLELQSESYVDPKTGKHYTPEAALEMGLISLSEYESIKKKTPNETKVIYNTQIMITDPKTNKSVSVEEGLALGLITQAEVDELKAKLDKSPEYIKSTVTVTVPKTGENIPIADALKQGLITPEMYEKMVRDQHTDHIINKDNIANKEGRDTEKELSSEVSTRQKLNENEHKLKNTPLSQTISFDRQPEISLADKTRARITTEPKYEVAIGRATSLSPERDAKKAVLQKLRKKTIKPKDALQKGLIDSQTADILDKKDTFISAEGEVLSLQEAVDNKKIDGDKGKIVDPQRGDILTINEAISRGVLDPDGGNEVLIPLNKSLSVPELFDQGLIDPDTSKVVHPETGAYLTLKQAIQCDIVDPLSKVNVSDGKVTLSEALDTGKVDNTKAVVTTKGGNLDLQTAVEREIFDKVENNKDIPPAAMTFPVALSRGHIDLQSKTFIHPITQEKVSLSEAFKENYIMVLPFERSADAVNLENAIDMNLIDTDSGTFTNPFTGEIIPIAQAVECGLLFIENTQKSPQGIKNVIIDVKEGDIKLKCKSIGAEGSYPTNQITFSDALNRGLIDMSAGTYTDPKSGEKMSISNAIKDGILEAAPTNDVDTDGDKTVELNIAEAFDKIYDKETDKFHDPTDSNKLLTFSEALEKDIIDPNSMIYDVKSQKPITIEQAVSQGLIDPKTGKIKEQGTGKSVDFKKAAKMGLIAVIGGIAAPIVAPIVAGAAVVDAVRNKLDKTKPSGGTDMKQKIDSFITMEKAEISFTESSPQIDKLGNKVKSSDNDSTISKDSVDPKKSSDKETTDANKSKITLPEAVYRGYYDPESGNFVDPENKEELKTQSAISRGYIDTSSTLVTINEEVVTFDQAVVEGIINTTEGVLILEGDNVIDFKEAFEKGLMVEVISPMCLAEALVNIFNPETLTFLDPRSGNHLSLGEAIEVSLIDPKSVSVKDTKSGIPRKIPLLDAIHNGLIDGNTGNVNVYNKGELTVVPLKEAFSLGLLIDENAAISLQRAIHQGLYDETSGKMLDPSTARKITIHESIRKFFINPLLPCYFDKKNKKLHHLKDSCILGIIDKCNGTFKDPATSNSMPLNKAMEKGLIVDIETANFSLYEVLDMGLYENNKLIHPATNAKFNLNDAVSHELINPNITIIKNIKSHKYILLPEALEENIINGVSNEFNLPTGTISFAEAKRRGLIVTPNKRLTLKDAVENGLYRPDSGKFADPSCNEFFDISEALANGLIDPSTTGFKDVNGFVKSLPDAITDGNIDVEKGRVYDAKSKNVYNFDKALDKGVIVTLDKPLLLQTNYAAIQSKPTIRQCTLEEAIKFELLDPKIAVIKDPQTGDFKSLGASIDDNTLNADKTIVFEPKGKVKSLIAVYDQVIVIYVKKPMSFEAALEKDYLDINTGKFTDPQTNEILTLKESFAYGFIDPDTALVKDTNKKKLVKLPEGFRKGLVDAEKGSILDSATSKLHVLPVAIDNGLLITPKRSFTLIEAIQYGVYNPTTGAFVDPFVNTSIIDRKRLTLIEAIDDLLVDPSSTVIRDPETGTMLQLLGAIDNGVVDGIGGRIYDKNEDKLIDFGKALERGLIKPAEERQAVEEKYKLCDESLTKLLQWISEVEEKIATQDVLREVEEDLRNQINVMKQIKEDLNQHSGPVSHCLDQIRQLVLTAGDILSKSEVSTLEKNGRNLKTRYDKTSDRTDKLIRRMLTARDELHKLKGELSGFSSWLDKARRILEDKERALSDLQRLDSSADSTREFVSDVISHQADLRFITMSAQKFVDESKDYLTVLNEFRTTLPSRMPHIEPLSAQDSPVRSEVSYVTQQYRDLLHRANMLSDRLSGVGGKQREYNDAMDKARSWLRDAEPRAAKVLSDPIGGDPRTVEDQLYKAKALNNEFVASGRLIDNVKQASVSLLRSLEGQISPLEITSIEEPVIVLEQKYNQLKNALGDRCQELDTALVQSQGVQDALDNIVSWLTSAETEFKNIQRPASLIKERLEEQIREHQVYQSDVDTHISSIDSIYLSASDLISSSSNTRVAKKIEDKLNDVKHRFEKLLDRTQRRGEFLQEVYGNLITFNSQSDQFDKWFNGIVEIIESRDFSKLSIEDYASRMQEIGDNRDNKQPLFEEAIHGGKELVNKRDVTDTAPVRDAIKSMENRWRDLNNLLDEKQKLSKQRSEQLNAYETLREQVNEWLSRMETKVSRLDVVAVDMQILQKQSDDLKPIAKDYRDYAPTIDRVNDVGNLYDSLLRDRPESPSRKRASNYSPTKRTSSLRRPSQDGRSPSPTKGLSPLSPAGSSGFSSRRSSQDGFHLEELSPVQQQLSEINNRYSLLGVKINDRQNEIDSTRDEVRKQLDNLKSLDNFLDKIQRQLIKDIIPSTKEESDKINKQLKQVIEEMYEKQSLLDSTRSQVKEIVRRKPSSIGVDNLNDELEDVLSRWKRLNDVCKDQMEFMENMKEFHDTHDSLAAWLNSKDKMFTVLGPISSDPRMVQSQVQQVQVLREEFRTQQPQLHHLRDVGNSVLTFVDRNSQDGQKIEDKLNNIQNRWSDLLGKLDERADSLGAAADTSREFDAQLTRLRDALQGISEALDELPMDKDPEEQLRKIENLDRQLEGQRPLLADLEAAGAQLCNVLSDPASRADIQAKLAAIGRQYNALQKKLDHRKAEIENTLRDGRQFEASCAKTLGWLSDELGSISERLLVSADRVILEQQLSHHEPVYREVLSREHEVIMLLNKGRDLLARNNKSDTRNLQRDLDKIQQNWDKLRKETVDRHTRLQTCLEHCKKYYRTLDIFMPWLRQAEDKLDSLKPSSFKRKHIEKQLKELQAFRNDVWKKSGEYENTRSLGESFISACDIDKDVVNNELVDLKERWDKLNNDLLDRTQSLEDQARKLMDFNENLRDLQHGLERCEDKLASHDSLGGAAKDPKLLDRIKTLRDEVGNLSKPFQACKQQANDLSQEAQEHGIDGNHLLDEVDNVGDRINELQCKLDDRCADLQSAATAVTQFNDQVKELTHDLSGLEAELDSMKPPGRDVKTVRDQIDDVSKLVNKLNKAADDVNFAISAGERLVDSGFAPDTAQTRQQVDTLKKQLSKLDDRARGRELELDNMLKKLDNFYMIHSAVIDDIQDASEEVRKLKPVGTDVEAIRAQQQDIKRFRAKTVDPLGKNVDECNRLGQGLIQSAAPEVNTNNLEKELERMNDRWNNLKERMNDRERRLDVALLQSGKFQEALDGLDKWLTDTEELVENQKPPSADYKVVKAQLQEQKFLKKMLLDRQNSMSSLYSMGNEIAKEADPSERRAIEKQLKDLIGRFEALREGAQQRTLDLEQAMKVAKEFLDKLVPLQEWLDRSEKKVKDLELIPTDEEKIRKRIQEHDVLHNDILSKKPDFNELADVASNLMSLVGEDEASTLADKLTDVTDRYGNLVEASEEVGRLLNDSRQELRHLVITYQDLVAWMDTMETRLGRYKVLAVHTDKLLEQMDELANVTEDIASRQGDVDGTVDAGVELMKHISSDEALQLKDKLDSLQRRYNELTSRGADLLKHAQDMLPLVEQFHNNHSRLVTWMQGAETILQSGDPHEGDIARLEVDLQELRPVLETINLVGPQLCQASPGEGAATIEGLVTRDNRRFDAIAEQIQRRAERIHLGKQRALEVTSDIDELLEWFREVENQIRDAEKPSADPDMIRVQLKEHKALNDDISSQKGRVRDVLSTAKKVLRESPPSEDMSIIREKMEDLRETMDTVSALSSDRLGILEQAFPLAEHFHDTHGVLSNWLGDMEEQVSMLSMPALRPDLIAQQQDRNEMFLQSINEHKPLVDKLNKTGEALIRLCNDDDGTKVQELIDSDNDRYAALKLELRERQQALEEALQESSQFSDKLEGMLRALSNTADQVNNLEPISAHPTKINDQIEDNDVLVSDLDKRKEAYAAVKRAADDVINKAANRSDPAIKDIKRKLDKLKNLWDDVQKATNTRGKNLDDTLTAAEKFWKELNVIMEQLKDLEDSLASQEPPAVEPKAIQKQQVALQEIRHEIDHTKPHVDQVRNSGQKLMQLCGEPDKPEVKKHIEDLDNAWDNITALYAKREENLIDAMEKAMEFHETLHNLLEFLERAEDKFGKMGPLGTDIDAVKKQIEQLKRFKSEVDPHMVKVEALNRSLIRQAQELTERTSADQAAAIKEPLLAVNRRWDDLLRGIVERQRQLENALLRLGQFQHALNELLVWISKTDRTLDELKPVAGDPQILEVELAKLKVLINDIQAHQTSVDTLNDAGRQIIESGDDEASVTQDKLNTLNTQWRSLIQKAADRQRELEDALTDAQRFNAEIQDLISWLGDVDGVIAASKPVGGLPETASEQLERFMEVYNELEENRPKVETVLAQGQEYLKRGSNTASNLQSNLRTLKQRWDSVTSRANDKKIKLEIALKEATEFHDALQAFVDWLTNAEKHLNNLKSVSRVLETIQNQIEEHKLFQKDVNAHREIMLNLDKKGTHLKYFSQKQDVILIKNLLISVQHRWERVASKSAERTRALDLGYKEAKEFHDSWSGLMNWLDETEANLDELDDSVGNNPEIIKSRLSKHQEFQRALSAKQSTYDNTMKIGKTLKEKAPKNDEPTLKQMLNDLKNKWTAVCNKSVDRQRKLEEALLYSGQFKEAIAALLQWLQMVEKDLSQDKPVHGDLDTVTHLVDEHTRFEQDLEARNIQMSSVMKTGHELEIKANTSDSAAIRSQLVELNELWESVSHLTNRKSTRLEDALREAEKLHKSVHMLLDWLSNAEMKLRFAVIIPKGNTPEDEAAAYEQLQILEKFRHELREKEVEKDSTIDLAHSVLTRAHPDAVNVIKQWITIIQSRWEEVSQWAKQRYDKLSSHMQSLKDLDECLEELISWLLGLESTLVALKQEELPMDIPATESLIADHKEFMENTDMRSVEVNRVCKARTVKQAQSTKDSKKFVKGKTPIRGSQHDIRESSPDYGTLGRKQSFKGSQNLHPGQRSRTSPGRELGQEPQLPHYGPRFQSGSAEPEFKSPRVKFLWDKWRHVWMLSWERQRDLNAHLAYLKEKERADNFSWDDWRKRFLKFMNHKKSRLTDLFRKMDKNNDNLIPRQDFIDGIINTKFDTNRLEMKEVSDMFDRNNRGLIDWKEFIAALRPDWEEKKPDNDAQKIHDEVKRLVMLCTCRQKFRVFQVGEGKYRFGDSQKLRLVRILRSTVMVRVGGGWIALDEFLLKNDPCRAKGRTNIELREQFILADGVSQSMTAFKPKTSTSGSSASSLRTPTTGPITKVRERSVRSVPMSGSVPRTSKSSLSVGTPDSLSDTEGPSYRTPRKSSYRTGLTPGGSRSNSRPASRAGSRPGSKPPSRHGSNLSLDSTADDTPSRIPRRTPMSGRTSTTPAARKLNGTSLSRPRTPTGLISPASPAGRSTGIQRASSIPTLTSIATPRSRIPVYKGNSGDFELESPSTSSSCSVSLSSGLTTTTTKTRTVTTSNAPILRTASRTRTPSGSNTPVPAGAQTAAARYESMRKSTSKEPFRL